MRIISMLTDILKKVHFWLLYIKTITA